MSIKPRRTWPTMELWLSVALIAMTAFARYQTVKIRDLEGQVKGLQSAIAKAPIPKPTTESECAQWLFSTDLKAAKARICGRPVK